ncbi:MAG: peptide chain release factor N(5)-glutamine methyltransferase [Eggerthellaceae bacterium]|nr:peptide chain release factor N(5)-glutamine methyltransferase [Eggerthellaceae bacterium]
MEETWNIRSVLDWTQGYLLNHGIGDARSQAQRLVCHALSLSRVDLFLNLDKPLSVEERDILRDAIKRRVAGEPLQYITGKAPFRFIDVIVDKGVLIPRPETEVLVSEVLRFLDDERFASEEPSSFLVADICTGSGCIAASLASEREDISVIATDISNEALDIACRNIEALGLRDKVSLLPGDLGSAIDEDLMGRFDAIVSNPPYVPSDLIDTLEIQVASFEPRLALDGGSDGLDIFRRLLPFAHKALRVGGLFACELHETSLEEAVSLAQSTGFDAKQICDLNDKPRVLLAYKRGDE